MYRTLFGRDVFAELDRLQRELQTAFEEADECLGWLEYLRDSKISVDAALEDEALQLSSILGAAVKTARRHQQERRRRQTRQRNF